MSPIELARAAVAAAVRDEPFAVPVLAPPYRIARPVFVTLKKHGRLRGCIGSLVATRQSLGHEIAAAARSAALRDPRFPAVTTQELPELSYEISILEPAELVHDLSALDPAIYGVIVSRGRKRGVLLPGIASVTSVSEQLRIARSKAGLGSDTDVQIERFRVTKVTEA